MSNLITLKTCVDVCYSNDEFIKEFNKLNGANLKTSNSFYNEIDIAIKANKN